jgi:hypothetical protein
MKEPEGLREKLKEKENEIDKMIKENAEVKK